MSKDVTFLAKYTDDEIRNFKKITCKIAGDYLGISAMAVSIGMRNDLLPIGFAIKKEDDRYSESWSYHIVDERLIAYKHGKMNELQIQNIEKYCEIIYSDLNTIETNGGGSARCMLAEVFLPKSSF